MLVLRRKLDQRVRMKFGDVEGEVVVSQIKNGEVLLGFDFPREVDIQRDNRKAVAGSPAAGD